MPITGAGRWARALSGQATTAPPRNAMSSRRLTRPPKSMQVQSIDFAGQLQSIAASQGAEAPDVRCGSSSVTAAGSQRPPVASGDPPYYGLTLRGGFPRPCEGGRCLLGCPDGRTNSPMIARMTFLAEENRI